MIGDRAQGAGQSELYLLHVAQGRSTAPVVTDHHPLGRRAHGVGLQEVLGCGDAVQPQGAPVALRGRRVRGGADRLPEVNRTPDAFRPQALHFHPKPLHPTPGAPCESRARVSPNVPAIFAADRNRPSSSAASIAYANARARASRGAGVPEQGAAPRL